MNNNQIAMAGMDAAKTQDVRWLVIDLLSGWLDGYIARAEAERELTGLVDDPAALLDRVGRKGETL